MENREKFKLQTFTISLYISMTLPIQLNNFLYKIIDRKITMLPMLIEKRSSPFTFMMENPKNIMLRWIIHEYERFFDKILNSVEYKRF